MEQKRIKVTIILATCVLHSLILLILLVIYQSPTHNFPWLMPAHDTLNDAETIFYDSSNSNQQTQSIPQQEPVADTPEFDGWAQLKPGMGKLASTMEELDNDIPESSDQQNTSSDDPGQINETPSQAQPITQDQITESHQAAQTNYEISDGSQQTILAQELGAQPPLTVSVQKLDAQQKKLHAQKSLAGITKGYLQYLENEGNNLIKTVGGDPNKKPTAEQLKYENYVAKIFLQWQNACKINGDKIPVKYANTSMHVCLTINRAGKMADLIIRQSSGDTLIDNYVISLWNYASSSFPPLPAYIKNDTLVLPVVITIQWDASTRSFT